MQQSASRWLSYTGLLLWLLLPIGCLTVLYWEAKQQPINSPVETWVPIQASEKTVRTPLGVALTWESAPSLVAPAWSGMIERIYTSPGDPIETGTRVLQVGGVDRIAVHSAVPFSRPLTVGDQGEDVGELNKLLASLNLQHSSGNQFSLSTSAGVTALSKQLKASGSSEFLPEWVIYLPADQVFFESSDLQIGTPAPTPGTDVIVLRKQLTAASLIGADEVRPTAQTEASPPGQNTPDTTPLTKVQAPEETKVFIGATEIPLSSSRTDVEASFLPSLQKLVNPGALQTSAHLQREASANELVVPAAAIFSDVEANQCVIALRSDATQSLSVPVSVVSDADGLVAMHADLKVGDQVNVSSNRTMLSCG